MECIIDSDTIGYFIHTVVVNDRWLRDARGVRSLDLVVEVEHALVEGGYDGDDERECDGCEI